MSHDQTSNDIEKAAEKAAEKANAARRAVEMVHDGQLVGLGTGSTAIMAIQQLGKRVAEGLKIRGVATSVGTHRLAAQLGIPMIDLNDAASIDLTIDGADQIDPAFNMIKGGGGALVREKLVAIRSMTEVIVVDSSKQVAQLGTPWSLPVEVVKFAWRHTANSVAALGSAPNLRKGPDGPFESDNGNYILDCDFGLIDDAPYLERTIKLIPGVVECGLFIGLASVLIVGDAAGAKVIQRNP